MTTTLTPSEVLDADLADITAPEGATARPWEDDCGTISRTLVWFEATIDGGAHIACIAHQDDDGMIGSPVLDIWSEFDSPTPDQARRMGEALCEAAEVAERVSTGNDQRAQAFLAAVRNRIARAGVEHDELASRIGMEPDRLARKLTGRAGVGVGELIAIADVLGCKASELLFDSWNAQPSS